PRRRPGRSARAWPRARVRQQFGRRKTSSSGNGTRASKSSFVGARAGDRGCGARALVVNEKAWHGLVARVATASVGSPSEPGPTIRPTHDREVNGGGNARGRGAPADRGSRCLVRVPRGDSEPVREPLPRGRAVGLGTSHAAPARDQGARREAPAGRCVGASSKRRRAASPTARVPT